MKKQKEMYSPYPIMMAIGIVCILTFLLGLSIGNYFGSKGKVTADFCIDAINDVTDTCIIQFEKVKDHYQNYHYQNLSKYWNDLPCNNRREVNISSANWSMAHNCVLGEKEVSCTFVDMNYYLGDDYKEPIYVKGKNGTIDYAYYPENPGVYYLNVSSNTSFYVYYGCNK